MLIFELGLPVVAMTDCQYYSTHTVGIYSLAKRGSVIVKWFAKATLASMQTLDCSGLLNPESSALITGPLYLSHRQACPRREVLMY